jgi:hypothetical protein
VDIKQKNKKVQDQEYQVALNLRKQILDSFTEIDRAAKTIKGFEATGCLRKVYDNIFTSVLLYLQNHMFTLEVLPFQTNDSVPVQIETQESLAIKESIKELHFSLEESVTKRRFEDAEEIRSHIKQLEYQLSKSL